MAVCHQILPGGGVVVLAHVEYLKYKMIYDGVRRKFTIFLLVVLIFICFVARDSILWRQWFVLTFGIGFLYLAGRWLS